jgi:hypothetical protein
VPCFVLQQVWHTILVRLMWALCAVKHHRTFDENGEYMNLRFIKLTVICLFFGLIVSSCTIGPLYYTESNLNRLSVGVQRNQLISAWDGDNGTVVPLIIRASKVKDGELIEIGEMPMWADVGGGITNYWFLFIDGTLKQWGEPRDWQDVKARYEINYNPSASVSY